MKIFSSWLEQLESRHTHIITCSRIKLRENKETKCKQTKQTEQTEETAKRKQNPFQSHGHKIYKNSINV